MPRRPRKPSRLEAPRSLSPLPWSGSASLELVHEFNELFIEQMVDAARRDGPCTRLDVARMHRDLWTSLDAPARRRLGQCPFLLADIQFRNAAWWERAQSGAVLQDGPPGPDCPFSRAAASELMRDALVVAWSICRQDRRLAATLLLMSGEVARIVARLGLAQLRNMPDRHYQHLRPLWEYQGSVWDRLLTAARHDDRKALCDMHLHAFQLADAD